MVVVGRVELVFQPLLQIIGRIAGAAVLGLLLRREGAVLDHVVVVAEIEGRDAEPFDVGDARIVLRPVSRL